MSKDGHSVKSIEELLDLVNSNERAIESEEDYLSPEEYEVRNFIQFNEIVEHKSAVPQKVIYNHYRSWCKHEFPLTATIFITVLKQYFTAVRVIGVPCFKIDPSSVGLHSTYTVYRDTRFMVKKKEPAIKFKGVIWNFYNFIARVQVGEQNHFIGYYKTQEEAAYVHDVALFKYYGKEAEFNFKENINKYKSEEKEGYPSLSAATVSSTKC